jgi:hypothetical protein
VCFILDIFKDYHDQNNHEQVARVTFLASLVEWHPRSDPTDQLEDELVCAFPLAVGLYQKSHRMCKPYHKKVKYTGRALVPLLKKVWCGVWEMDIRCEFGRIGGFPNNQCSGFCPLLGC